MTELVTAFIITFGTTIGLISVASLSAEHQPRFEDKPGWSCVDDGNRVCGPDNDEGKTAGCYSVDGALQEYWPCGRIEIQEG